MRGDNKSIKAAHRNIRDCEAAAGATDRQTARRTYRCQDLKDKSCERGRNDRGMELWQRAFVMGRLLLLGSDRSLSLVSSYCFIFSYPFQSVRGQNELMMPYFLSFARGERRTHGPHADNPFIRSIHTRPTHSGATAKRHSKTGMFAFAICVQFISRKGTLADGSQMNSLSVRPSDRRHVLCYISCSRWRTSWADFNSIYGGTYGRAEIKENATIHLSEPSHFAQKANTIKTNLGGARVRASSGAKSVA